MEGQQLQEFLRDNHRAILSTRRRDGRPQMSPILFALGDDGRLLVSTRGATAKANNIRRSPGVSLCVVSDRFFGEWAQVDGEASIIEMPEAAAVLRDVYRAISGEHPDWDEFDAAMVSEGRVVLAVKQSGGR
jgi:PPOX class probable F420-dependent enzyme